MTTTVIQDAITAIVNGEAFLVIVDDSSEVPAFSVLRQLMSTPFTCAMPVLTFLSEQNYSDTLALQRMNQPEIVDKPLTPAKFLPKLLDLFKRWETPPFFLLRQSLYQLMNGNEEGGLKILKVLCERESTVKHCALQVFATYFFRVKNDPKTAEKFLLASLKQYGKNLASITTLGDIYMRHAMPKLAQKLFQSAKNSLPNSLALNPDIIQSSLMLSEMDQVMEHLVVMHQHGYMPNTALSFLSRVMVSEGSENIAEASFNIKQGVLSKIQRAWDDTEEAVLSKAAG